MTKWNSRGLRGSAFEELINFTNEDYKTRGLALIQKVPTPITPVEIDSASHHITLAYFDQQSTVDYIGAVQGVPVCFDAKECETDTFPLHNVHEHQMDFMERMEMQDGKSFLLIFYKGRNEIYYVPFLTIKKFWDRMENGGRKSFRFEELEGDACPLQLEQNVYVRYLEGLKWDLERSNS